MRAVLLILLIEQAFIVAHCYHLQSRIAALESAAVVPQSEYRETRYTLTGIEK